MVHTDTLHEGIPIVVIYTHLEEGDGVHLVLKCFAVCL